MKTINPNVFPKRGRCFIDSDGTKIVAETWNGVMARVVRYRQRKGVPVGDVKSEVINQACQHDPIICSEDDGRHAAEVQRASLKARVLGWLNALRANKPEFVDGELAKQRANICASCPMNQGIPDGCSSCRAALEALRNEVIGRRTVDARLNACVMTGEDLPGSVHMELQTIDNPALPGHCWRKRTL